MVDKKRKEKILFICTNNSARSQMAEGYLKHAYNELYEVYSAGIKPTTVNPYAIKVMSKISIDITNHTPKSITEFENIEFDYIITVCGEADQECPFFPNGKKYIHKGFKDPACVKGTKEDKIRAFMEVRDEIIIWIDKLINEK